MQRRLPFALLALAAALSGRALAQPAPNGAADNQLESAAIDALISKANETPEKTEEITVEGQRRGDVLARYRLEMTQARDHIVDVFNRVNTKDDTDVKCRNEKPTGTRMGHSICRSKSEDRADSSASSEFLRSLFRGTNLGIAQDGRTPHIARTNANPGTAGAAGAQTGAAAEEDRARAELEAEMRKMMAQNRELYRAVVKYVEVRDEYNKVRDGGDATAAD
jgi:hypothetical protein